MNRQTRKHNKTQDACISTSPLPVINVFCTSPAACPDEKQADHQLIGWYRLHPYLPHHIFKNADVWQCIHRGPSIKMKIRVMSLSLRSPIPFLCHLESKEVQWTQKQVRGSYLLIQALQNPFQGRLALGQTGTSLPELPIALLLSESQMLSQSPADPSPWRSWSQVYTSCRPFRPLHGQLHCCVDGYEGQGKCSTLTILNGL